MREFIFTSNRRQKSTRSWILAGATGMLLLGKIASAGEVAPSPFRLLAANDSTSGGKDRTLPADPEEFSTNPFTDYGEFNNQDQEEEADTKFLQFGHLFGVSIAVGQDLPLGNRGKLWQGGFPLIAGELHYWFDFHLVLDLGVAWAQHYFNSSYANQQYTNVSFTHIYLNLRYYFDTKNLSAPISFASPYVLAGFGDFSKTQKYTGTGDSDSDSTVGITGGVGLEFPILVNSAYFDLQATISSATFNDTYNSPYQSVAPDLSGPFTTFTGGVMFTW